jgi:hypothetical protein
MGSVRVPPVTRRDSGPDYGTRPAVMFCTVPVGSDYGSGKPASLTRQRRAAGPPPQSAWCVKCGTATH